MNKVLTGWLAALTIVFALCATWLAFSVKPSHVAEISSAVRKLRSEVRQLRQQLGVKQTDDEGKTNGAATENQDCNTPR